jgi:membrane-associated phospholipid phosphatase
MEPVLQWGLDCIRLIQSQANPPLTLLMKVLTHLGSTVAYIIILPLIYWCVDEKKGLRLGIVVLISVWLNLFFKLLLNQPRPFFVNYDPSLGMISETLGGLPSGHAQNTLALWAIIASWVNKKWMWGVTACFCLLVAFSRVYLGVHFPSDVLGGWIIGGVLLTIYFLYGKRIETLLVTPRVGLIACAALAFVMILYRPLAILLMPGAMVLGLGTGYYLCKCKIGFSASTLSGRTGIAKYFVLLVRFLLGITVLVLWYVVSEKITARFENSDNYNLFVFLRFGVIAFIISAGAPWLFRSLRLADSPVAGVEDPPVRVE